VDRDAALEAVARIADAVTVPVTADIESGYAEDTTGVAAERIAAAREAADAAGVPLFLNARTDTFLSSAGVGAPPMPFGQWGRASPWSGPTGSSSPGPSTRRS
jgi:2-methylisocitrate lyase-like PEP mutase family enzyme